MADLEKREKEYLRLNQQLDKLASTALKGQKKLATSTEASTIGQPSSRGIVSKAHGKGFGSTRQSTPTNYGTYTKAKTERRQGAGDLSDGTFRNRTTTTPRRETYGTTWPRNYVQPASNSSTPRTKLNSPRSPAKAMQKSDVRKDAIIVLKSFSNIDSNLSDATTQRKQPSSLINSRTFSRVKTKRDPINAPLVKVKYRNENFVESPSLQGLINEEMATLEPRAIEESPSEPTVYALEKSSTTSTLTSKTLERKNLSSEGLMKFLKTKIKILEEDHASIASEMKKQKELLDCTLERHKKVEQQRDQASARANSLAEQVTKVESQLEEANQQIKDRTVAHSAEQKYLETMKRNLKVLSQTNKNLERRLLRVTDELEATKKTVELLKDSERKAKESARIDIDLKDKQIKSLKKERSDLWNAYRKQLFLIDNLKRQNTCYEQSKMLTFSETEFTKALDWDTKS